MAQKNRVRIPKKRQIDPEVLTLESIEIGERKFTLDDAPTVEQDMEAMSLISDIGIDSTDLSKLVGTRVDRAMKDVIVMAYKSGKMFRLLGCVLVEEDTEWSPEVAEEAGELFRTVRDAKVKTVIEKNIVKMLTSFFVSGLFSPETSPNSSIGDIINQARSSGASSITGNGSPSSGKSQAAIRSAQERLNGGRSGKRS